MDNRSGLWRRFVSRLRGVNRSYRYESNRPSVTVRRSLSWSLTASVPVVESSQSVCFPWAGDVTRRSTSLPPTRRFTFNFTPKCLSGLDARHILSGEDSYDDFVHNCWLEDHLHRFASLNTDLPSSLVVVDDDIHTSYRSISDVALNESSFDGSGSFHDDDLDGNGMSSLSRSTLSDVTHFFNAQSSLPAQPPPYSEFPQDPPPSYTEAVLSERRPTERTSRRDSSSSPCLHDDILW